MRTLLLAALTALAASAQDVVVDRAALTELLAKKKLVPKDVVFDFEHLDSMPPNYVCSHSNTKSREGQLAVWRRAQKAPLTLPEEVQRVSGRILKGELWEAMSEALDRPALASEMPAAAEIEALPTELSGPVGTILAAIEKKEPALIWKAIVAARPALEGFKGDLEYAKDGVVLTSKATPTDLEAKLTIRFGGDDVYKGSWASAKGAGTVRVLIDTGGNDRYEAGADGPGQGSAQEGGIAFLVDFAGNDAYVAGSLAQGAANGGAAVLWDAAGDDRYEAGDFAQGAAQDGIGVLIDDAGNDSYLIGADGQAFAFSSAFALLLDRAGDDTYHARDATWGEKVTNPAPQDPKHNASMAQGCGMGHNGPPYRAGGLALLIDVAGDDRYEAGCWAQGVGYFQGIGACLDLAGDDSYEAWVYIMGSGAHGGFGLQIDARGDDTYKIGGWNGPAMSVDYGMDFFLDGQGNDHYAGPASGCGCSIGLGISLFQDSSGDDWYEPKDDRMGSGVFYENEDYNQDGKITPAEKRHWGLFLDGAGSDRYPAAYANGKGWDKAEFSGGLDVAGVRPDFSKGKAKAWDGKEAEVTADNWETVQPADLLKLLKGDNAAKAAFAFEHGLWHEGADLLAKVKDPKPLLAKYFEPGDRTYNPRLHLWLTEDESKWALVILQRPSGVDSKSPGWVRREAAWLDARKER